MEKAANEFEAFIDEHLRIMNDGGIGNPNNYNNRNSPGKKLYEALNNMLK